MSYREEPAILTDTDYLRIALAVENQERILRGLKSATYDQLSSEEASRVNRLAQSLKMTAQKLAAPQTP